MSGTFKIGRLFGVPLRVHWSWFIIFILIAFSMVTYLQGGPAVPLAVRIFTAVLVSLLFFGSIVFHELAHSLVALRQGIPVKDITLFIFGGVSQITRESSKPGQEFLLAIAGPFSSLFLAAVFYGVFFFLNAAGQPLAARAVQWLAFINLALAVFNLVPGFPLDGGRVLRSIVWGLSGNYQKATRAAAITGRVIAWLLIAGGIAWAFTGQWFNGLWLVFIGWFLDSAAANYQMENRLNTILKGFTARDVMSPDCTSVPPWMPVSQLVHDHVLPSGRRCALVVEEGKFTGLVTIGNVKETTKDAWDATPVKNIMVPADKIKSVTPDRTAAEVVEMMDREDLNQVPVMENGQVIGMVARDNVIRFIRTRAELGMG
jgi:Zn-dependent protease/CBS domain-containing protein